MEQQYRYRSNAALAVVPRSTLPLDFAPLLYLLTQSLRHIKMPPPSELHGIMVALVTPFKSDTTEIDCKAIDEHVKRLIDAGVHGLVPGGSTGEFTVLSTEEREHVLDRTIQAANGRVPVCAGIGDLSTERTVRLAKHAAKAGAASVMVVPPFYDALSIEQLHEYLDEIHAACKLPITYYNIPSASGMNLSPEQIADLSHHGVRYMKDTSGNAPALTELLFHRDDKVTTFNGWDTLTFYGLAAGAKGSVWGATNFIPELSMELWDAVAVKGDLARGRELWRKIWPICNLLEQGNYAGAVKTGMELRGWSTGGARKPFGLLKDAQRQELARLLEEAGVNTV